MKLHICYLVVFSLSLVKSFKLEEDVVVQLNEPKGKIRGHILKSTGGKNFYSFQEIPYAAPPIGENRFKLPKKHLGWEGILNTTANTKQCVQSVIFYNSTEDCLYSNVYTPVKPGYGKLPVLVYIHGGAFISGTSGRERFGPENLMDYDIVVVTMNYRVGPFGFLQTGDGVIPGNIGLKDQRFALEWVQKNIHLFGGDPTKVTIWGESAGASSVSYHLLGEKSSDLFRAAMAFSASATIRIAYTKYRKENAINLAKEINPNFNSTNSKDILELLMNSSSDEIYKADAKLTSLEKNVGILPNFVWGGTLENENDPSPILTAPFHQSFLDGKFKQVPLLYGFDSEEILSFTPGLDSVKQLAEKTDGDDSLLICDNLNIDSSKISEAGRKIKSIYTNGTFKDDLGAFIKFSSDETFKIGTIREAEITSKYVPVYLFEFSYSGLIHKQMKNNISVPGIESVGHGEELSYLWKLRSQADTILPAKDLLVSAQFLKLITNFVKYLNPTPEKEELLNNVTWPILNGSSIPYLNINETLEVTSNPIRYISYRDILMEYVQKPYIIFS